MKAITPGQPQPKFDWLTSLMTLALLIIFLLGCRALTSRARGRASNLRCASDVGFVNGGMDAGVKVSLTVTNVGEAGIINIRPHINTSEGEWSRSQDIQFRSGESMNLSYFFDEPTINATNIQCTVAVSP